jgi:hypothetical protein
MKYGVKKCFFRFDETRKEKDMRIQAQRLADGEHELFMESHIDPKIFKVEKKDDFFVGTLAVERSSKSCIMDQISMKTPNPEISVFLKN